MIAMIYLVLSIDGYDSIMIIHTIHRIKIHSDNPILLKKAAGFDKAPT